MHPFNVSTYLDYVTRPLSYLTILIWASDQMFSVISVWSYGWYCCAHCAVCIAVLFCNSCVTMETLQRLSVIVTRSLFYLVIEC